MTEKNVFQHFNISQPTDVIETLWKARQGEGTDTPRLLELARVLTAALSSQEDWNARNLRLFAAHFTIAAEWGDSTSITNSNFFILSMLSELDFKTIFDN